MMHQKCPTLNSLSSQDTNKPKNQLPLSCYLSNVRFKLNKKKAEYISAWCQHSEIDIIFLTETGVDPDKPVYFEIKGFEKVAVANKKHMNSTINRLSNECGGSMILWKTNSKSGLKKPTEIIIENSNSWFQMCGAKFESGPHYSTLIAICVYRSPSCTDKSIEIECYDRLEKIVKNQSNYYELKGEKVEFAILGDLNCDADWKNMKVRNHPKYETMHLFSVLERLKMRQFITEPTCNKSTLDVICATFPVTYHVHSTSNNPMKLDHAEISATLNFNRQTHWGQTTTTPADVLDNKLVRTKNTNLIRTQTDEFPWSELMYRNELCLEQRFDCLVNVLEHIIQNSYETKPARKSTLWFSNKTKKLLRSHIDGKHNRELECSLQSDYDSHIFEQSMKFTRNPDSMWKYLRKTETRNVSSCRLRNQDGSYTENKKEQATLLTKTNIAKMNPFSEFQHIELEDDLNTPWIDDIEFDDEDVHRVIQSRNSSDAKSHSRISMNDLKAAGPSLAMVLRHFFMNMLLQTVIPDSTKCTVTTYILKNGKNPEDPNSYRPIQVGCPIIRVFECLLAKEIDLILEMRDFYHQSQLGYCQRIGCTESLLASQWWITKTLNKKEIGEVHVYFFDQTSAFDRIDFAMLIKKLKHQARISGRVLSWIIKWLKNRSTCTKWSGEYSNKENMTSGSPQGSGLSAIFFKIYLNESLEKFERWILELDLNATFYAFADDVKYVIAFPKNKCENYNEKVRIFFERVENEYRRIGMLTNASKCKYIVIKKGHRSSFENVTIRDSRGIEIPVELSDLERDLGLLTDNGLTFETHRRKIISKSWTSLNFTTAALTKMSFQTATVAWNNVFGQISYLSEIWWNGDSNTFDKPYKTFFRWQQAPVDEKASKINGKITKAKVPYAPSQMYVLKDLKILHRILHRKIRCIDPKEIFPNFYREIKPRSVSEMVKANPIKSKFSKQFVLDRNELLWNSIPSSIRADACEERFLDYVKNNILTTLPIEKFREGIRSGEQRLKSKIWIEHRRENSKCLNENSGLTEKIKRASSLLGAFDWSDIDKQIENSIVLEHKEKLTTKRTEANHMKDCNCQMIRCKSIRRTLKKLRMYDSKEKDLNRTNHDSLCKCGRYSNHERSKIKLNLEDLENKIYETRCPEPESRGDCNCRGRRDRCVHLFYK